MAISFVGKTGGAEATADDTYLFSRPSGVAAGDLLIGCVIFYDTGDQATVNTPSGWTKVRDIYAGGGAVRACKMSIFKRTAASGDPSTWSGTLSSSEFPKAYITLAYRGTETAANQFIAQSGTTSDSEANSLATATVNNTNAAAWRITVGGYVSASTNYAITSNEVTRREIQGIEFPSDPSAVQMAAWDSNAAIATGNTSRSVSREFNWSSAAAWIGLIKPENTEPPSEGSITATAPKATATIAAKASHDGPLALVAPKATAQFAGNHEIPADGPLAVTAPKAVSDISVATVSTGTVDAVAPLARANLVTETKQFGDSVIIIEPENRTIMVLDD